MRTLTQRELHRALLARQGLLERFDRSLPRFVEASAGLQTQYAPSGYIGTWSRLEGFERGRSRGRWSEGRWCRPTLMRSTIHMVSRRDYWPIAIAVREHRRRWWLQATRHAMSERDLETWACRIRACARRRPPTPIRAGQGTRHGLHDLERCAPVARSWCACRRAEPGSGEEPTCTAWRRTGSVPRLPSSTPDAGLELLVRRYLTGFGPASRKDISSFTGVPLPAWMGRSGASASGGSGARKGNPWWTSPGRPLPDTADPRTGSVPADLGRHAAGPRAPDPDPAGAPSGARLPRQDPAVDRDLPSGRPGGRHLASRRRSRPHRPVRGRCRRPFGARSRARRTAHSVHGLRREAREREAKNARRTGPKARPSAVVSSGVWAVSRSSSPPPCRCCGSRTPSRSRSATPSPA